MKSGNAYCECVRQVKEVLQDSGTTIILSPRATEKPILKTMAFAGQKESKFISSSKMLLAGGCAGAVARTATAPLDRIKLLFQVQAMGQAGTTATSYTGIGQAFYKIFTEEGVLAFWKGNGVNIIRIFPYSASQFMANDQFKRILADENGKLTVAKRLTSGALAGMTGTALTHPLDTVRLRLALPNHAYKVRQGVNIGR